MKVQKILNINSMEKMYEILTTNPKISESNPIFLSFMDYMWEYYYGCKCLEKENLELAKSEYVKISTNSDIIPVMSEYFQCDGVRFSNN